MDWLHILSLFPLDVFIFFRINPGKPGLSCVYWTKFRVWSDIKFRACEDCCHMIFISIKAASLAFGRLLPQFPWWHNALHDVVMSAMASQITSLTIVYSSVYSVADQRKQQSSASLAFVRWSVISPHMGASNTGNVFIWWRHLGYGNAVPLPAMRTVIDQSQGSVLAFCQS